MRLYQVFETDMWLSRHSQVDKGIFTTEEDAIEAIVNNHCIPTYDATLPDKDWEYYLHECECLKLNKDETEKRIEKILKEHLAQNIRDMLDIYGQTQGYSVNYRIETIETNQWN